MVVVGAVVVDEGEVSVPEVAHPVMLVRPEVAVMAEAMVVDPLLILMGDMVVVGTEVEEVGGKPCYHFQLFPRPH